MKSELICKFWRLQKFLVPTGIRNPNRSALYSLNRIKKNVKIHLFLRTLTVAEGNWGQVMGRNVNDKVEGFCQEDGDLIWRSVL